MIAFILRRLAQALFVALIVVSIIFLLLHLLPGDQARAVLGIQRDPRIYGVYDAANGLDTPLPVQYANFVLNLLHGRVAFIPPGAVDQENLTLSGLFSVNADIGTLVVDPLPKTLLLVGSSCALAVAVSAGLVAYGIARGPAARRAVGGAMMVVYAVPPFLLAILLTGWLADSLHVVDASPAPWLTGDVLADPAALLLPVLTLAAGQVALFTRYLSGTVAEVEGSDHVATARAKGAGRSRVILHHVLRNSMLPFISLSGLQISGLLAVDAIVEYVFGYPGLGATFLTAGLARDFYTLLGALVLTSLLSVLGSLVADIAYAWVDPRIRYRTRLGRPRA